VNRTDIKTASSGRTATGNAPFWEKPEIGKLEYDRELREWPETVFAHFSSAEMLKQWLAPRASVDFRKGGVYVLSWGTQGSVTGEFLEIMPGKLIKFTWEDSLSSETVVTISFIPFGTKTIVRLAHQLFGGATKAAWNEGHLSEWSFFLDNLQSVVEVGKDMRQEKAEEDGWGWILGTYFA
jgi:uncharacterized protein YndB with AHSA1/START domain